MDIDAKIVRTLMLVLVDVVQAASVEGRGAADNAVDLIALAQQQLRPELTIRCSLPESTILDTYK